MFLNPPPPKHKNMPRTDARTELGELFLAWHKRFRWFQDPTEEMNWSFEDPNFLEVFSKINLIPGWHCLMFLIKDFEKNIGFSKNSINSLSISHHFVYLLFVASFQKFANLPKKKKFLFDFASGHTMKIHRSKVKRKQNPTPQVICSLGFWPGKKLLQRFLVGGWPNPFDKKDAIVKIAIIFPQGWFFFLSEKPPPRIFWMEGSWIFGWKLIFHPIWLLEKKQNKKKHVKFWTSDLVFFFGWYSQSSTFNLPNYWGLSTCGCPWPTSSDASSHQSGNFPRDWAQWYRLRFALHPFAQRSRCSSTVGNRSQTHAWT